MRKKLMIGAIALVVVAVAAYFLFFRGDKGNFTLRFDKVSKGSVTVYVTATGTINAVTSVDVGTQVSGIVSRLYADFNSIVKEGQVIAKIDSTPLVQAVNNSSASLERARAQLADATRTLDREKLLFEKGLDSQANYDAARTAYETNLASMKQAEVSVQQLSQDHEWTNGLSIYSPSSRTAPSVSGPAGPP